MPQGDPRFPPDPSAVSRSSRKEILFWINRGAYAGAAVGVMVGLILGTWVVLHPARSVDIGFNGDFLGYALPILGLLIFVGLCPGILVGALLGLMIGVAQKFF